MNNIQLTKNTPDDILVKDSLISTQERSDILFNNSEILAPMVRASSTPLRVLALFYGADVVFTEEIIDRSIIKCDRVLNEKLNSIDFVRRDSLTPISQNWSTKKYLGEKPIALRIIPFVESGRIVYQSGTSDSTLSLLAAQCVERDVSGIDINMGCPKKFSISGGMGSALLSDLPRATDIIKTLRRNISLPISAKIRLLKDTSSTIDFIKGLVHSGLNAITIHAREVGDRTAESAKWDKLIEVVQLIKSSSEGSNFPVVVNGDLYTRNDMINIKRRCGADSIMIARPALYNTSLFCKPSAYSSSENYLKITKNSIFSSTCNESILPLDSRGFTCETHEETRYGYNSHLLLSKNTVIQDYLRYSISYHYNFQNIKYVVCEMINNRRTPSSLVPLLSQNCNYTVSQVCKCKNINELCSLWSVEQFPTVDSKKLPTPDISHALHPSINSESDIHNYDDDYFF